MALLSIRMHQLPLDLLWPFWQRFFLASLHLLGLHCEDEYLLLWEAWMNHLVGRCNGLYTDNLSVSEIAFRVARNLPADTSHFEPQSTSHYIGSQYCLRAQCSTSSNYCHSS